MRKYISKTIIIPFVTLTATLTGCSTGTLRDVTGETGGTSTDILYDEVLTNIAMIRFYDNKPIYPASYEISSGSIAINDTVGSTAGSSYASITHLFTPSLSFTGQRVFQKSWGVSTQDDSVCLDALKTIYSDYSNSADTPYTYLGLDLEDPTKPKVQWINKSISYVPSAAKGDLPSGAIFHEGPPLVGDYLQGKYRGETVWVDPDKMNSIVVLNDLVKDMLEVIQSTDRALAVVSGGNKKPGAGGGGGGDASQAVPFINVPRPVTQ